MSVKYVLERFEKENISIGLVDQQLKLLDPENNLTEDLLVDIRKNKSELIALLSDTQQLDKSDFPLAKLNSDGLAEILKSHSELQDIYVATPLQQGLLFHGLLDGRGADYTSQTAFDIVGQFDINAFKQAWQFIVNRQDIFRTCFAGLEGDEIHQVVSKQIELEFYEQDLRALSPNERQLQIKAFQKTDKAKGFDFEQAPLMRFSLLRIADDRYHFVWSRHHALLDGWCIPIVFAEVLACFTQLCQNQTPDLPFASPYKDYIRWLSKQDQGKALTFWQEYMSGFTTPTPLSIEQVATNESDCGGCSLEIAFNQEQSDKLNALALENQCTMNTLVQSAWSYLLHRYSGELDVVFGTTMSGRPAELSGVERMIGLFINVVPARVNFEQSMTVADLLSRVHSENISRNEYSYFSLLDIQKVSELERGVSLFDSLFTFQNYPVDEVVQENDSSASPARIESFDTEEWSTYALDVNAVYTDKLTLFVKFMRENFSEETILRMLEHLKHILMSMVEGGSELAVADIELLSQEERQQVLYDWNQTSVDFPVTENLQSLFSTQAQQTPDNLAMVHKNDTLTYQQLEQRSNQWASYLMAQELEPGAVVGIYLERSLALGVAMLAVLKAGGSFVLLDTDYPQSRVDYMLADSGAKWLLTDSSLQDFTVKSDINFAEQSNGTVGSQNVDEKTTSSGQVTLLTMDKIDVSSQSIAVDSLAKTTVSDIACLFYTSGSTGQPKAVKFTHQGLLNYAQSMVNILDSQPSDRMLQMASVSFDVVLEEILPSWLSGGAVVINDEPGLLGAVEMQQLFEQKLISCCEISFAQWREWLYWLESNNAQPPASLRIIMVGCESIPGHLMAQWAKFNIPLIHVFGLTETTITSSTWDSRLWNGDASQTVPAGKPIANTEYYILDSQLRPQPIGVAGELYIGGAGVAAGYLNRPTLSEERFIVNPISQNADDIVYRTGDRARWLADGNIAFIGRSDDQVKIRGFRVELGEIENQLNLLEQVKESVVVARADEGTDKRLVAYVVPVNKSSQVEFWPPSGDHFLFDDAHYVKMMNDTKRNELYQQAFNKRLKDKTVLEVGPGAELVLTQMCIKAGVKHIYAVEINETSFINAQKRIDELDLNDKVTLFHGDVKDFEVPENIDYCISELIGTIGNSEGAGPIMNSVRKALPKNTNMIPKKCITQIAAVELPSDQYSVGFNSVAASYCEEIFRRANSQFDLRLCATNLEAKHLLSNSDIFENLDFTQEFENDNQENVQLTVERDAMLTGFAVWINLHIDDEHVLDVFGDKTSSFSPSYFPISIDGLCVKKGELIEGTITRQLNANGIGYDYLLDLKLHKRDGQVESLVFNSYHQSTELGSNEFYQGLVDEENGVKRLPEIVTSPSIKTELQQHLPSHMVPSNILFLETLPLNLSGKIDKNALPAPSGELVSNSEYVAPESKQEIKLAEIWAKALGVEQVGVTDNFFELGGDSIISIQVASRATQAGIAISVRQLFEFPTIGGLLANQVEALTIDAPQCAVEGKQVLLPIHHWFFAEKMVRPDHNNMSVLLEPPAVLSESFLRLWIKALYCRHDALRLRFLNHDGLWSADYESSVESLVESTLELIDMTGMGEQEQEECLANEGQRIQSSLCLADGQLMRVAYFKSDTQSRLLLVIHHGVVDGVSLRIIFDDLELAYQQFTNADPISLMPKTSSYQRWAECLEEYGRRDDFAEEARYWRDSMSVEVAPLEPELPSTGKPAELTALQVSLNKEQTEKLLRDCPSAYRTQVNELLLTALWYAMNRWTGQNGLRVWMEGHGREELFEHVDLTQTVGWFTTMYPLTLSAEKTDLESVIKVLKEQYRALPNKGLGYGVVKYLLKDLTLDNIQTPDITFNYLGQIDQTVNAETAFKMASEYVGRQVALGDSNEALLGINGLVTEGCLNFGINYDKTQFTKSTVKEFGGYIKQALGEIIEHCCKPEVGSYTPSDFPLASVTQEQLDQWQQQYPNIENIYPSVPVQQGMLFQRLLEQQQSTYMAQMAYSIEGPLKSECLRQAWQTLIGRHVALRTVFVGLDGERIQQMVLADAEIPWVELDWSTLDEQQQADAFEAYQQVELERGFDFEQAPLIRISVIKLSESRYRILWSYFMGVFDGWSLPIINKELFGCYRSLIQDQIPTFDQVYSYQHYIEWLSKQDQKQAECFWKDYLQGFNSPNPLMVDTLPVDSDNIGPAEQSCSLSIEASSQLDNLAKSNQCTMNVIAQFAWAYLLRCYSGESDVVFGTTVSGRPAAVEGVEHMLGLFINTIPARVKFDGDEVLGDLLKLIHKDNVMRDEYSYVPLADIQRLSDLEHGMPMFHSYLVFQNYPVEAAIKEQNDEQESLRFEVEATDAMSGYGLDVSATYQGNLTFNIEYLRERFSDDTITRMLEHLKHILMSMVEGGSELAVADIELLSQEERQQVLYDWNQTSVDFPVTENLQSLFSTQAQQTPDNLAMVHKNDTLTYQQLEQRSNQWASYLMAQELEPGAVVGIYLERSLALGVAMLAVLKAGGSFVLLDTDYPQSRVDYMLADSGAKWLLTDSSLQDFTVKSDINFAEQSNETVGSQNVDEKTTSSEQVTLLTMDKIDVSSQSIAVDSLAKTTVSDIACLFYTSGSTGQPKAVKFTHQGLLNYAQSMVNILDSQPSDRMLQMASVSFDVVLEEILPSWLSGGAVVINDEPGLLGAVEMQQLFEQKLISCCEISFAQWREWLYWLESNNAQPPASLRIIMVGCESIPGHLMAQWAKFNIPLIHVFGLTETTITSSTWDSRLWNGDASQTVPAGKPIANTEYYILDSQLRPQPIGVAGELYIGGAGVAAGYLNRPTLSEERFIVNPISQNADDIVYRTGDRARWLADGNIAFIGRSDDQVKIRGFRVELGEIENQLNLLEQVKESVVVARADEGTDKRLVAYVVVTQQTDAAEIKQRLHQILPAYMVPSNILVIDKIPLTLSGKVDKKSLPSPSNELAQLNEYIAPESDDEIKLCGIWAKALGIERVGVTDNFFELGGDSIISIQIASRATQAGIAVSVRKLFEFPRIRDLLVNLETSVAIDAYQGTIKGEQVLLPIQHWFFAEKTAGPDHNNMSVLLEPPAELDEKFLRQWIEAIYLRHDALSLSFSNEMGYWSANYQEPADELYASAFELIDMAGMNEQQQRDCIAKQGQRIQTSLSLANGELLRVAYFKGDKHSRLLIVIHHAVVDGVSWRIILEDLELAYAQFTSANPIELLAKTSSYQRWAECLVDYGRQDSFAAEAQYWRDSLSIDVPPLMIEEEVAEKAEENAVVQISLSEANTDKLLRDCPSVYRTQINELLLAALWIAVNRWTGQTNMRVWMEGHGREDLFEQLDLSQSVGWFTTMYPLTLHSQQLDTACIIKTIKEQYRELPNKGLGYGIVKYLQKDSSLINEQTQDIIFNYLGQFDQTVNDDNAFKMASEFAGETAAAGDERESKLVIESMVIEGCMAFGLKYCTSQFSQQTMSVLGENIEQALQAIIDHCSETGIASYTPSDFPLAQVNQQQLDRWQQQYPNIKDIYATVPMQQGMLFHRLLDQDQGTYIGQVSYVLKGEFNSNYLRQAWQNVISRHAVFRTVFIGLESEQIQQMVLNDVQLPWLELDWSDLDDEEQQRQFELYQVEDKQKGFDFEQAPLMRISVIRLSSNRYRINWSYYMGLFDGWSISTINKEVFESFQAIAQDEDPVLPEVAEYKEYIGWIDRQEKQGAEDFWREHLSGITSATTLRVDNASNEAVVAGTQKAQMQLSFEVSEQLNELAKANHSTLNVVVQAAWAYLLSRYSGESDVVFGTTVSGRPAEVQGVEDMVGLFINTIPARINLAGKLSLNTLLKTIHKNNIHREEYSYMPLVEINRLSDFDRDMSMFESYLVFQNFPVEQVIEEQQTNNQAIEFEDVSSSDGYDYKLMLVAEYQKQLKLTLKFGGSEYSSQIVKQLLAHLEQILVGMAQSQGEMLLSEIEMLTEREQNQLMTHGNQPSHQYSQTQCIHQLFQQQTDLMPNKVAIVFEDQELTYQALNEASNRLAHYLIAQGVTTETLVGICVERSLDMMIGILGILKAGGAYVPLDPSNPTERLQYMLQDSGLKHLLTHQGLVEAMTIADDIELTVLDSQSCQKALQDLPVSNPESSSKQSSESLAYIIYTSGSTGLPKGVMVEHRNVHRLFQSTDTQFQFNEKDVWTLFHSYAFDFSVWEIWGALIYGGRLVIVPWLTTRSSQDFCQLLEQQQVTILNQTPSAFQSLIEIDSQRKLNLNLRQVIFGGEALDLTSLKPWVARHGDNNPQLVNMYGITETTVHVTYRRLFQTEIESPRVASLIGQPLSDLSVYLMTPSLQLTPQGSVGELYVAGAGLSRGYLAKPELTAERFIQNPLSEDPEARLYKTGDLARFLPDGSLEFIGRSDEQVKIRGFRIELGEIEHHLSTCQMVASSVVIVREDEPGQKRLIAYVVTENQAQSDEILETNLMASWRLQLQKQLPDYMLPTAFVILEQLPLTSNGKLDRKALPAPGIDAIPKQEYVAPDNEVEEKLCGIWEQVLKVERIGVNDNFFALGGDSIISIQMVSRAKQHGLRFSVRDLFENPTILKLAPFVNATSSIIAPQEAVTGSLSLLPIQRAFFAEQMPAPSHYNQSILLQTPVGFGVDEFKQLIAAIYQRHDALRLRFNADPLDPSARHYDYSEQMLTQSLMHRDLSEVVEGEREEHITALCNEAQQSLDLTDGPLIKALYCDLGGGCGRLFLVLHHLVVDGVTWRILLTDLEMGWQQLSNGETIELLPKSSSYQQWGEAIHEYAGSPAIAEQRDYWLQQLAIEVSPIKTTGNKQGNSSTNQFQLNKEQTQALLGKCNDAYRTRPNELMLAALLIAWQQWTGGDSMTLDMEGHGREELFDSIDTSDTLGWFTSVYPLILSVDADNGIASVIKEVKEQFRGLPSNGIGYGILRYIAQDPEILALETAQERQGIEFNYLGQFDNVVGEESIFKTAPEPTGTDNSVLNPSPVMMSVTGMVHEHLLGFAITSENGISDLESLSKLYQTAMINCIEHCESTNLERALFNEYAPQGNEALLAEEGIEI